MNEAGSYFIKHIKYLFYLYVFICFSVCNAGSYDDFFMALRQDDGNTVRQLLQRGFDPNTPDPKGQHGLMVALQAQSFRAAHQLAEWPKTRVEARNTADESPLMLAALHGELALCQALIQRDADVNKPGWTPLHYAATNGHVDVMRLLLQAHAYIDSASPNGTTPLMMAAHYGNASAVKLLLEEGADVLLKNQQGLTALDFAHTANRTDSVAILTAFIRARQPKGTW